MARADLLLNLVKAGTRGDQAQFQRTVEALVVDERAKKHDVLADRLLAQIRRDVNGQSSSPNGRSVHLPATPYTIERAPERHLCDLVLPPEVEEAVSGLIEEQHRGDLLRSYNLTPRNRVLLAGPPGNGKTSLTEAIADALHVPLLTVRYDSVIASYLGETAQRIGQVFEHARSRRCVLFFDEFDAIAKERGDPRETGEIKRVVSSLLLQVDDLPSHVVVVAASNHPELLDRAVWRRFQLRLELPMPQQTQIERWVRHFEEHTGQALGMQPRTIAQQLVGLSFSEVEDVGTDILRKIVLGQPGTDPRKVAEQSLRQWRKRFRISEQDQ